MDMKNILITVLSFFCCTCNSFGQSATNKDNPGKSVTIGTQIWTVKNLNVDKFRNGDVIREAKTSEEWVKAKNEKTPAWCYYNNDAGNGEQFGKLYNWYAVKDPRGLAPKGWHVPTEDEWSTLLEQLGGDDIAGEKMKSTSGWGMSSGKNIGNGTNESGFNALPGSSRFADGGYNNSNDKNGTWWSATPWTEGLEGYTHDISDYSVVGKNIGDGGGLSVRCIKD
jgi:uncharacterized protein (TIGR02145 family)